MILIVTICKSFSVSDWISVVDIIVTSFIGIWIGVLVQKNITTNRAVKEYFISENRYICDKYRKFMNDLYSNKTSAKSIQEWFKIMTIKIHSYDTFLKNEYKIDSTILEIHNELKYYITASYDFNTQYTKKTIELSNEMKTKILSFHHDLTNCLTRLILDTNKAKRRYFKKKQNKGK